MALTAILLLIFMSNQFVQYLNRAASGSIPGMVVMKLMLLELPNLLSLLLPLGFYIALLLVYGRLYAENEMTVLRASGYGPRKLFKHSFIMASITASIVAVAVFWGSPLIAIERAKLLRATGVKTLIQTVIPKRFHAMKGASEVFYVQSMNRDHTKAQQVFLAKKSVHADKNQWDILWADKAFALTDKEQDEDYLIFQKGQEYQGIPGQGDYQIAQFSEYKMRLPQTVFSLKNDIRTAKTWSLLPFNQADKNKIAELQWRISIPLMVFTLTLVGIPLSNATSRTGKYAKLLPAILIYILYANFMFVARDAVALGKIPPWIGMWWLHICMAILGLLLIWRNRIKLL